MKVLFLIFHGFEEFNGISKKIRYQIQALKDNDIETHTCYLTDDHGHKKRMIDNDILKDYGCGIKGKILKRTEFKSIINYCKKEQIDYVYIRYDHNANPFTIRFIKRLKQVVKRIAMEIPTYPYDLEYKGLPAPYQRILFVDKCFRKTFAKHVDNIVTFSDYEEIWNRPTIQISNGIDFSQIKIKEHINDTTKELHLLGVATIHPWHGFDRAIKGLIEYYKNERELKIYFHIVGYGVPEVVEEYKQLVATHHLEEYVIFHSALFGEKLDEIFNKSDMGIGSLARHRSNIDKIKTLKNREYAARGIPFVYSETDDDFENMPYTMKAPANESPLDIDKLLHFFRSIDINPTKIRKSIENTLSWKVQMKQVINELIKE